MTLRLHALTPATHPTASPGQTFLATQGKQKGTTLEKYVLSINGIAQTLGKKQSDVCQQKMMLGLRQASEILTVFLFFDCTLLVDLRRRHPHSFVTYILTVVT